jgi:RNA polymerase sigma-70 factor (ECF subfamily)
VIRSSQEIYEELLITRCRRRDLAAWDELVRNWNDRLLYYLRRLIEHEHDARNALQDAWLQAFRGIHTLRDDGRLAPWLYTIVRRSAMFHLRTTYQRRERSMAEATADELPEQCDDQLLFENADLVHFGLGQLELPDREVLTLFFLDDLSVQEMAEVLSIPSGTVKSRMFKARGELRHVLQLPESPPRLLLERVGCCGGVPYQRICDVSACVKPIRRSFRH